MDLWLAEISDQCVLADHQYPSIDRRHHACCYLFFEDGSHERYAFRGVECAGLAGQTDARILESRRHKCSCVNLSLVINPMTDVRKAMGTHDSTDDDIDARLSSNFSHNHDVDRENSFPALSYSVSFSAALRQRCHPEDPFHRHSRPLLLRLYTFLESVCDLSNFHGQAVKFRMRKMVGFDKRFHFSLSRHHSLKLGGDSWFFCLSDFQKLQRITRTVCT